MIKNRQFRFRKAELPPGDKIGDAIEAELENLALRWYIAEVDDEEVVVEATVAESDFLNTDSNHKADPQTESSRPGNPFRPGNSVVVNLIPTGVGCEVGGYAGDAAPAARLLAKTADYLITNPNAVNASHFISLEPNLLYTEGLCIDRFLKAEIELFVPNKNRVGLIVEQTSSQNLDTVYNVVNTARAVFGVDLVGCEVTEGPIGSHCALNRSGAYVGTVDHPEEIFRATERLIARGAQAIAITTNIQDLPHDEYVKHFAGEFPNPMGGVEAIMSHMIVNRYALPAAHAPMINTKSLALRDPVVDARGAGEMASESGLACILIGLAKAPQFRRDVHLRGPIPPRFLDAINVDNVLALVAPSSCLGGVPMIEADRRGIPIIAVRQNETVLNVTAEKMSFANTIEVENYAEAAGVILALRHGIDLDAIQRPLATLRPQRKEEAGTSAPQQESLQTAQALSS